MRQNVYVHAFAVVGNLDAHVRTFGELSDHDHLVFARVIDGVVYQVVHDLRYPLFVGVHQGAFLVFELQFVSEVLYQLAVSFDQSGKRLYEVEGVQAHFVALFLLAAQVQHVVDQSGQTGGFVDYDVEILALSRLGGDVAH